MTWTPTELMARIVEVSQTESKPVVVCVSETDKILESVTPYAPTNTPQEGRHD